LPWYGIDGILVLNSLLLVDFVLAGVKYPRQVLKDFGPQRTLSQRITFGAGSRIVASIRRLLCTHFCCPDFSSLLLR
jgi:hypothetical protein